MPLYLFYNLYRTVVGFECFRYGSEKSKFRLSRSSVRKKTLYVRRMCKKSRKSEPFPAFQLRVVGSFVGSSLLCGRVCGRSVSLPGFFPLRVLTRSPYAALLRGDLCRRHC